MSQGENTILQEGRKPLALRQKKVRAMIGRSEVGG
jgi:hypothetical protein